MRTRLRPSHASAPLYGRPGFTPAETLVVLAITCLAAGLLLSAIQKAREAVNRLRCQNHLKQIGVAFQQYESNNGSLPQALRFTSTPLNVQGWGPYLLPYLGQQALFDKYDQAQPFFTAGNQAVIATSLNVFLCPSTPRTELVYTFDLPADEEPEIPVRTWKAAATDYSALGAVGETCWELIIGSPPGRNRWGALEPKENCRNADFPDGTATTILLAELAGRPAVYHARKLIVSDGGPSTYGAGWGDALNGVNWVSGSLYDGSGMLGPCLINCTNETSRGLYGFHPGGTGALMCDGSVRFLSEDTDSKIVISLIAREKREAVLDHR